MSEDLSEIEIRIRLQQAEKHIDKLELEFEEFKVRINKERVNSLLWGISALGTVITVLIGIIWANRGAIFK